MQGTWHVRSLIRLFIGAALLCLAWLVLTSGHASAAERPAPAQPLSDLSRTLPLVDRAGLETVLGSVLGKPSAPTERPADRSPQTVKSDAAPTRKPMAKKPSAAKTSDTKHPVSKAVLATTIDEAVRQVVPVLEQMQPRPAGPSTPDCRCQAGRCPRGAPAGRPTLRQVTDAVVALVISSRGGRPVADRAPAAATGRPPTWSRSRAGQPANTVPTAPDALRQLSTTPCGGPLRWPRGPRTPGFPRRLVGPDRGPRRAGRRTAGRPLPGPRSSPLRHCRASPRRPAAHRPAPATRPRGRGSRAPEPQHVRPQQRRLARPARPSRATRYPT